MKLIFSLLLLASSTVFALDDEFDFNLDLNGDFHIDSIEVKKWLNEIDAQLELYQKSKNITLRKKLAFVFACDLDSDMTLSDQEYLTLKLRVSEIAAYYNKLFIEQYSKGDGTLDSSDIRSLKSKFKNTIPGMGLEDVFRTKPEIKLNSSLDIEYI